MQKDQNIFNLKQYYFENLLGKKTKFKNFLRKYKHFFFLVFSKPRKRFISSSRIKKKS